MEREEAKSSETSIKLIPEKEQNPDKLASFKDYLAKQK